jgi:DNA-binding transcriptional MocR family regulator
MSSVLWGLDVSKVDGPRYLAVAGAIARAIDSGELPPGAQLPPQRDLADRLGVTVGTVSRAYALARKRRLIVGEVGRGTFVQGAARGERTIPKETERGIDLACFRSPAEGLSQTVVRSLLEVGERASLLPLHRYTSGQGARSHRLAGVSWIARSGLVVPEDRVLLTNGAQEAVAVALSALTSTGDTVLTEEFTYSGLKALANLQGLRLRAVASDRQGMIPDALERMALETGARVVYLQPTVHNPTTASMPESRRREIAAIIERLDLMVIEDDAAASALAERPLPVTALVPEYGCYITSLSKSVSPALRTAYLTAGADLIGGMIDTFHALALGASPITAEIASLMIGNGSADTVARGYVALLSKQFEVARRALDGHVVHGTPGAFYVWMELPERWNADDLVAAAKRRGLSVPHPDSFQAEPGRGRQGLRISLSPSSQPDMLHEGLTALRDILASRPQLRATII